MTRAERPAEPYSAGRSLVNPLYSRHLKGRLIMARTATLGIVGFLLSVVFVLATLWWVPDSASAAEPVPPGPVVEVPDVPSRAVKSMTGSAEGDKLLIDLWRIATGRGTPASVVNVPPASVKPLTPPQPVTRPALPGGTGAATALVGVHAGLAVGSNGGLLIYGAQTGQSFDEVFCNDLPDWYKGVQTYLNLGFVPGCPQPVTVPNADQPLTTGPVTYSGGTVSFVKTYLTTSGYTYHCYLASSQYRGFSNQWTINGKQVSIGTMAGGTFQHITWIPSSSANPVSSCSGTDQYWANAPFPNPALTFQIRSGTAGAYTYEYVSMTQAQKDPTRNPRCKITWPDGSVTMGNGQPYKESSGIALDANATGCSTAWDAKPGAGTSVFPRRLQIESEDDTGAKTEIANQEVPDWTPDQLRGFETGNGRGLVLEKIVAGAVRSCMTWDADCTGWWADTADGTQTQTATGTYRCTFAGEVIALAECGVYRHTFDVQTQTPTITNPVTGAPEPWGAGVPGWSTITPTVTGGGACGASWSWNPVDWVLNPLKCAFVPSSTAVQGATASMSGAWAATSVAQGMAAATAVFAVMPDVSGCAGPRVQFTLTWPALIEFDAEPLNACDPPISYLALTARVIGSLILIGATAWGVTRRVGAVFNSPGVGPS